MNKIIKVQGKWYNLLGMWGGQCYLGNLTDMDNEVEKSGIIWEMQPFFYEDEVWYGKYIKNLYNIIRKIRLINKN